MNKKDKVDRNLRKDEITATTFQLKHKSKELKNHFVVGDRVVSPCGDGYISWLDKATGNCMLRLDEPLLV